MAQAVLHGLDERLGLAGELEDLTRQNDVLDLVAAPDVVDLALAPLAQDQIDARAVVEDVEPVAHVPAVAVERQRLVVERVGHEERNDLLRILMGPEVVRRAGDQDRHPMGVPVGQREQVPAGLRGRVRVRRPHRIALARRPALDRPVDLVGADVQEARDLQLLHRLEQREHAEDVGPEKRVGLHQRAVDVRFGGEVDDGVDPPDDVAHDLRVADVALHERVPRIVGEVGQVRRVPGVRQLVEIDDAVGGVRREDVADEVGADESASAGDQELHVPTRE